MPSISSTLTVTANLSVDVGQRQMFVQSDNSRITIQIPTLADAFRISRKLFFVTGLRRQVGNFSDLLTAVGLTVVVRTPAVRLLTIGVDGASWWLRLLGIRNTDISLAGTRNAPTYPDRDSRQ